ncbi:MAG: hypothetical protein RDU30_04655 [Desulfovibrionaceae bacterium]|nr:hypothetical protein [Desulfovibrionaceae bacterium]
MQPAYLNPPEAVHIEQKAYGHPYADIFLDMAQKRRVVIFATDGKDKKPFRAFAAYTLRRREIPPT